LGGKREGSLFFEMPFCGSIFCVNVVSAGVMRGRVSRSIDRLGSKDRYAFVLAGFGV